VFSFTFLFFVAVIPSFLVVRTASGKAQPLVLAACFALLSVIFFHGVFALGLALFLAVFTRCVVASSARAAAGFALVAALIWFKLPSAKGQLDEALPFLVFLPLGYSYQLFSAIGLWIDESRAAQPRKPRSFPALLCSFLFLPCLVAGPYLSASTLAGSFEQPESRKFDDRLAFTVLSWGLLKKVLADAFAAGIFSHLVSAADVSVPASLNRLLLFSARLYLDFSGYCDMAVGAALLLGYRIPQNFYRPFFAASFGEFWSRWNYSLSEWFKKYLFHPLMIRYPRFRARVPLRLYLFLATALVCGLIAAWHGFGLIFGFWYLLVVAGLWLKLRRPLLNRATTALLVFLSTSLVLSGTPARWLGIWGDVFAGGPGSGESWLLLLACLAMLLSVQAVDLGRLEPVARGRVWFAGAGIAVWSLIFLLGAGGGIPFLYARF
jgi:D-alanyl-lipoteichoic acid acyltransferase DltB (MBOAT superfamily)